MTTQINLTLLKCAADQAAAAHTNLLSQCGNASAIEFMALQPLLTRSWELSAGIKNLVAAIEATESEALPRPAAPTWTPAPLGEDIEIPF